MIVLTELAVFDGDDYLMRASVTTDRFVDGTIENRLTIASPDEATMFDMRLTRQVCLGLAQLFLNAATREQHWPDGDR